MKRHNPDIALIRKYLNGELSPREMYELERRAQNDPLLMDLMMGMEQGDADTHRANLSEIHQQLRQRVQRGKTKRMVTWRPWAVAASVALALTAVGLWVFRDRPTEAYIAQQASKSQEATPPAHRESAAEAVSPEPLSPTDSPESLASASPATALPSTGKRTAEPSADTQAVRLAAVADPKDTRVYDIADSITSAELLAYQQSDHRTAARSVQPKQEIAAAASVQQELSGRVAGVRVSGRQQQAAEEKPAITGIVLDKATQAPLSGATIKLEASNAATQTDSNGRFTIPVPSQHMQSLQASLIGYQQQHISVAGRDSLTIMLEQDEHTLSEIIVVGYDNRKKNAAISKPIPLVGWDHYNQYLREHARSAGDRKGIVTLAFTVDSLGNPTNIRIVKGLTDTLDQKAIQLVRDGSKWQPSDDTTRVVTLKIRFR